MPAPSDTDEIRGLLEFHARLIDLGYATDEYVIAQVAGRFAADVTPTDCQLKDAVVRAEVIRAMQVSFA